MKIIGLTGGIGSGKSVVAKVFNNLGISVYNSDDEAKKLNNESDIIQKGLIDRFGKDIYKNGILDNKKLANYIFNNKEHLNFTNSLIHPVVKNHFNEWAKSQTSDFVIKESAILFETGIYKDLYKTIAIIAPIELRIKRIIKRDKMSLKEIKSRIANQINDTERKKKSDFIIENSSNILILPQILEIYNTLSK